MGWPIYHFGIGGLIGMGLGLWLFATNVRGSQGNVFGHAPWPPIPAAIIGGLVFGFAFWFLIGFFIGIS